MVMDVSQARILIIDDEEANLRLLNGVLAPTYANVEMVSDARRIQDVLVEFSPDVVLVDLHMPHVSGYDVLSLVRSHTPADDFLPVVMITVDVSPEAKRRALALGATDFLTKPIDVIEVALRVANLVRTRFLYREIRDSRSLLELVVDQRTRALQEANEQLSDLIRIKDEFIASISHELRTPLSVVVGLAAELHELRDGMDEEESAELLAMVVDQSNDLAAIIEDLLVAARADIGTLTIVIQEVDLAKVLDRALAPIPVSDRSRITIDLAVERVQADPVRIAQILRNLVRNAVRYGGRRIGVRSRIDGDAALIDVWDDGSPLDDAQRNQIFEPYYTAHDLSGQPSAVGLGLTVSRNLAQRMGGDLAYHHDGDVGVFTLSLPRELVDQNA